MQNTNNKVKGKEKFSLCLTKYHVKENVSVP